MKEADLKKVVNDYLQIGMNQGKWYYDRFNSGEVIVNYGASGRHKVKLCREGTADFMVLMIMHLGDGVHHTRIPAPRIVFLELKSSTGRTTRAQDEFRWLVEIQGAEYFVIRTIEELEEILN